MDNVFVRRELARADSGEPVVLSFRPPRADDAGTWWCEWIVEGLDEPHETRAAGVDGVQAIQLAQQMAGAWLHSIATPLTWLGQPDDLGLPDSRWRTDAVGSPVDLDTLISLLRGIKGTDPALARRRETGWICVVPDAATTLDEVVVTWRVLAPLVEDPDVARTDIIAMLVDAFENGKRIDWLHKLKPGPWPNPQ